HRIRETHLDLITKGEPDTVVPSVVTGISRTGRLVTSAALILFLAFTALASIPITDVKVFATALAAGIIIDATLVRGILTPALVTLLGRFNWWFPHQLSRLLAIPSSRPTQGQPPYRSMENLAGRSPLLRRPAVPPSEAPDHANQYRSVRPCR